MKHNFLSVPVLQKTGRKWYGFLDMGDIVSYVTEAFGGSQLSTTQDFWALFSKVSVCLSNIYERLTPPILWFFSVGGGIPSGHGKGCDEVSPHAQESFPSNQGRILPALCDRSIGEGKELVPSCDNR